MVVLNNNSNLIGGGEGTSGDTIVTESWNGTNWTEVNDLNVYCWASGSTGSSNTANYSFWRTKSKVL